MDIIIKYTLDQDPIKLKVNSIQKLSKDIIYLDVSDKNLIEFNYNFPNLIYLDISNNKLMHFKPNEKTSIRYIK